MISKEKILVTLIFSAVATASLVGAVWGAAIQYRVMSNGAVIPATIERAWYSHGRKTTTAHMSVSYDYEGRHYAQSVMLPMWHFLLNQRPGDSVTVTVDKTNPADAWLASTTMDWIGFATTPILLAGLSATFALFGTLILANKSRVS